MVSNNSNLVDFKLHVSYTLISFVLKTTDSFSVMSVFRNKSFLRDTIAEKPKSPPLLSSKYLLEMSFKIKKKLFPSNQTKISFKNFKLTRTNNRSHQIITKNDLDDWHLLYCKCIPLKNLTLFFVVH